jgi:predicted aspartyl protease
MGRFAVDVEITNFEDLVRVKDGRLKPDNVRRKIVQGVVDSGATKMVLPESLVKELGLPLWKSKTKIKVKYGDGRRGIRNEVGGVYIQLQGREGLFTAIVEPKRDTALIGAIVLEDLDFLVDCKELRLVPRDPDYVVSEVE